MIISFECFFRRFCKEQIGLSSSGYKNIDRGSYFRVIVFSLTLLYLQMVFDVNIKGLVSVNDLTLLTPEIVASRIQEHRRKFRIRVIIQLLGVCGVVRSRFLGASHRLEAGGLFNPLGWGPGGGRSGGARAISPRIFPHTS